MSGHLSDRWPLSPFRVKEKAVPCLGKDTFFPKPWLSKHARPGPGPDRVEKVEERGMEAEAVFYLSFGDASFSRPAAPEAWAARAASLASFFARISATWRRILSAMKRAPLDTAMKAAVVMTAR